MNTVKIKKAKLLSILKKNKAIHTKEFTKALKNYRIALMGMIKEKLELVQKGKKVSHRIDLEQPMDQTKDYDKAIRMLELSVDRVIELSDQDFSCLVLDDWSWKNQFDVTNMALNAHGTTYASLDNG